MTSKLAIARLSKSFGDLEALRSISLTVERGEFISVVGPSGCGKTTFLRIVAGLEHASSGEVLLDGRAVREPGTDRGFVFQNDSLLPWRTVLANAIIGREVAGSIGAADRQRTMELLKLVGLEGFEVAERFGQARDGEFGGHASPWSTAPAVFPASRIPPS